MQNDAAEFNKYTQSDCPYSAGELILQSGLYEICHYDEPRTQTVLVTKSVFPFCRHCGEKVRYKLIRAVPHISEDPDFNEMLDDSDNPPKDDFPRRRALPLQLGLAYGFRFWQDSAQSSPSSPEAA
jgi:hypothetical protein